MQKSTILIIVFILILAGALYYYYSIYEPVNESDYFHISISAIDKDRKITGYEIQPYGIFGNTSMSYEQINLPGGIVKITNRNIGRQKYYENTREYNISGDIRVDLVLEEPELPKVSVKDEDILIVEVKSKNFQEVDFCLKGSANYIFLKAEPRLMKYFLLTDDKKNITLRTDKYNYDEYYDFRIITSFDNLTDYNKIAKEGYEFYDVCYDGEFSLKNENKILNISYTKIGNTNNLDYIKIALMDKAGNELIERIK